MQDRPLEVLMSLQPRCAPQSNMASQLEGVPLHRVVVVPAPASGFVGFGFGFVELDELHAPTTLAKKRANTRMVGASCPPRSRATRTDNVREARA